MAILYYRANPCDVDAFQMSVIMKNEKRNNIIEFYENEVWIQGMQGSDTLTDNEIEKLGNSHWFASWMLSNKFDECVKLIKNEIRKLTNHF